MSNILYNLFENFEKKRKYLEEIVSNEFLAEDPEMPAEELEGYVKVVLEAFYRSDPVCVKSKGKKTPYINTVLLFWQNDSFDPGSDVEKTHDLLKDYNTRKLSGHLVDPIENFPTFGDLYEYLKKDTTPDNKYETYLNLVYSNDKYNMWLITDWADGQRAFKDSGWCVQHESNFKNLYHPNEYFMVTHKGNNKRAALIHFNSRQVKDVKDDPLTVANTKYYDPKILDLLIGWAMDHPNPYKIFELLPLESSLTDTQQKFIKNQILESIHNTSNNPIDFVIATSGLSLIQNPDPIYQEIINSLPTPTTDQVIDKLDELIENNVGVFNNSPRHMENILDFHKEIFVNSGIAQVVATIIINSDANNPVYAKASGYLVKMYMALGAPSDAFNDSIIKNALTKIVESEETILDENASDDLLAFYFRAALDTDNFNSLKHTVGIIFKSNEKLSNVVLRLLCTKVESRISIDFTGTQEKINPEWPLGKLLAFSQSNREYITSIAKKSPFVDANIYIKYCTDQLIEDKDVTRILSNLPESATFAYSAAGYRALNDNHYNMFTVPKPEFQGNLNNSVDMKGIFRPANASTIQEFLKGDIRKLYTITFGNYIRTFNLEKIASKYGESIMESFDPAEYGDWSTLLQIAIKIQPVMFLTKLHLGKTYTNVGGVLGIKMDDLNMLFDSQLIEDKDIDAVYDMHEFLDVEWEYVFLIPKAGSVSMLFIGKATKNNAYTRVDNRQNVAYFVKNYSGGSNTMRYVYHIRGREIYENSEISKLNRN